MTILEFAHNDQTHRFVVETITEEEKQLFRTARPHLFDTVFPPKKDQDMSDELPTDTSDDTSSDEENNDATPSPEESAEDVEEQKQTEE